MKPSRWLREVIPVPHESVVERRDDGLPGVGDLDASILRDPDGFRREAFRREVSPPISKKRRPTGDIV